MGIVKEDVLSALNTIQVKGRLEIIKTPGDYTLMIDYAHNAMSLESLLTTIRKYNPKKIYCLFGCGGNRAKARRMRMGEVSSKLADLTVVTSDNPRNEEPMDIINDILIGFTKQMENMLRSQIVKRRSNIVWNMLEQEILLFLPEKGMKTIRRSKV